MKNIDGVLKSIFSLRGYSLNSHLIIILLVITGLLYRLPYLRMGLWRDEASTYFNIVPNTFEVILSRIAYTELNPPAFYLFMKQWVITFGADQELFKIPSLLFGVLLIPSIYLLGSIVSSQRTGIIAAVIATFHPQAIYYSQEARPYTLSMLLCCLTLIAYLHILESPKYKLLRSIGFTLICCLSFYTQYTGLIFIFAFVLVTLILQLRKKLSHRIALIIHTTILAAFLLFTSWLNIFILHLKTGLPWHISTPLIQRLKFYIFYHLADAILPLRPPLSILLSLPLVFLIIREIIISCQYLRDDHLQNISHKKRFVMFSMFTITITAMVLSDKTGRYMLPFYPIAWCNYGMWFDEWLHESFVARKSNLWIALKYRKLSRIIPILMVFAISCYSSVELAIFGTKFRLTPKSGIRSFAKEIAQQDLSQSFFLVAPDYLAPTFGYYFRDFPVTFRGLGRWKKTEIFSPRGYADIWSAENLIEAFIDNLQTESHKDFQTIYFIQGKSLENVGRMKYLRTNQALAELNQRYELIETAEYPGRTESIIVYRFSNFISSF